MTAVRFTRLVLVTLVMLSCSNGLAESTIITGWKTIKNTHEGFSIQYPPHWKARLGELAGVGIGYGNTKRSVRIQAGEAASRCCANDARDLVNQHTDSYIFKRLSSSALQIDGEFAYEVTYSDASLHGRGTICRYIGVQHHGKQFFIAIEEHGSDAVNDKDTSTWKYKKEIDQIIKSFKFTE